MSTRWSAALASSSDVLLPLTLQWGPGDVPALLGSSNGSSGLQTQSH
jgi:hypothetical protein